MDNSTANETWIDKLIDELVDAKTELIEAEVSCNQLYTLKELIFNNTAIDYTGKGLRIANDNVIIEYLRVIYPDSYDIAFERAICKDKAERACMVEEGSDNG